MSRTVRIVLILLGLVTVLGGLFAWSVEDWRIFSRSARPFRVHT